MKKRFRWKVWALLILLGLLVFSLEMKCTPKLNLEESFVSTLEKYLYGQDSILQSSNLDNIETLKTLELSTEETIKQFVRGNLTILTSITQIEIPVSFHLVGDSTVNSISNINVKSKIAVLSSCLFKYGFTFLIERTYKYPSNYFGENSLNLKNAGYVQKFAELVDKNENTLDVVLGEMTILGLTSFPFANSSRPVEISGIQNNWIIQSFRAFPGGDLEHYNSGNQLLHSIGHWLGLYHVFQDSCNPNSIDDYVLDTPNNQNHMANPM